MNSGDYRCLVCWTLFEEPDDLLFHLLMEHPGYDPDDYADAAYDAGWEEPYVPRPIVDVPLPPFEEERPPG